MWFPGNYRVLRALVSLWCLGLGSKAHTWEGCSTVRARFVVTEL